jgi:WD40 repeat protein
VGANDKVTLTVKDPADSPVRSVAFSANGEYLAAGAANGDVYLWKVSL